MCHLVYLYGPLFPHTALGVVLSSGLKRDFTGVSTILWSVLCFMLTVSGYKPADNHKIHCNCMLAAESRMNTQDILTQFGP